MGYSRNIHRIDKAFSSLSERTRRTGVSAVKEGTKAGYDYALDLHRKARHELHLTVGGDFAYGVADHGSAVALDAVEGKVDLTRAAERSLREDLASSKGVTGIVKSSMEIVGLDEGWEEAVLKSSFGKAASKAEKVFGL